MAEAGPSRTRRLGKLGSSSDGIELLDTDAVPLAARRRGRKPSSSRRPTKSSTVNLDDTESSSDEVVFVAASLAKKYSYSAKPASLTKPRQLLKAESPPRQRSESINLDEDGELKREDKILKPLVLKPPLEIPKAGLPPPHWLGRTAVLVPLVCCPVCLNAFRKADSGAARWRHISTCLTPPYKPPNPPPDLERLIHDALLALNPREPSTLLEHHANSAEPVDLVHLSESSSSPRKAPAPSRGLHRTSNVRPAEERGEIWEDEVHDRLREVIGQTSPIQSLSQQTLQRSPQSPVSAVTLPGTQPLGQSSLARRYPRSPSTPDLEQNLGVPLSPMSDTIDPPPSSQSKLQQLSRFDDDFGGIEDIDDIENKSPILQPFQSWGVARAEGLLPRKRSSASISPIFDRRHPLTFPR